MPVFVHCPWCGFDFQSRFLDLDNVVGLSILNVSEPCPQCGKPARTMEGNFNLIGDTVEMTSGPVWSRELLIRLNKKQVHALRASVAWAQQQANHTDDAHRADVLEKTVLAAVPQLEKPLRGIRDKIQHEYDNHLAAWVTALIMLITFIISMNSPQGISGEQLEQILEETVRHVQSEQAQTVDGEPTTGDQSTPGPEEPPPATEIPTPKTR